MIVIHIDKFRIQQPMRFNDLGNYYHSGVGPLIVGIIAFTHRYESLVCSMRMLEAFNCVRHQTIDPSTAFGTKL
jgi:hypothetical protein